jgi:PIF1-like helicase
LADIPGMPPVVGNWGAVDEGNRLLREQLDYNRDELAVRVTENVAKFNAPQQTVYNAVMDSVNNNISRVFFLHSAGGCGKTFVCNTIAAAVRAQGKICLCVASSGIASLLLGGGRTAHSTFRIPLAVNETSSVLKSGPVWSFAYFRCNRNRNWFPNLVTETGKNRSFLILIGSKTGSNRFGLVSLYP